MPLQQSAVNCYDPTDFGAKADGTTNDSTAVVSCIQAAIAGNGKVYFPPGTYNLASIVTPTFAGHVQIDGAGRDSVTILGANNKTFALMAEDSSLTCKNVRFDTWQAVFAWTNNDVGVVHVTDCRFHQVVVSPTHFISCDFVQEYEFSRNVCTSAGYITQGDWCGGVVAKANQILSAIVRDNEIRAVGTTSADNYSVGIRIGGLTYDSATSSVISGNRVYNVQNSSTKDCIGILAFGRSTRITDNSVNMVLSNNASCVDQEGIYTKCSYSVIANNTLVNAGGNEGAIVCKGEDPDDPPPPATDAYGSHNVITGNTIRWDDGRTIKKTGIRLLQPGIRVTNNIISGATQGISTDGNASQYREQTVIENNTIVDMTGDVAQAIIGLYLINPVSVVCRNNTLENIGTVSHTVSYGVYALTTASNGAGSVIIEGNTIKNVLGASQSAARAITMPWNATGPADLVIVRNNTIDTAGYGIITSTAGSVAEMQISGNTLNNCTTAVSITGTPTALNRSGNVVNGVNESMNPRTPEMHGAVGNGVADDTSALTSWAAYMATQTSGRFVADGLYRVTNTITFDDVTGVTLSIGCATLDALNYRSTDPPSRSGILYDGSAGTGPEPNNCKPAVWIKRLNFAVIEQIIVAQHKDTAETNTTGILLSAGDSSQRGNSRIGTLYAGNFYRGIVVGLRNYSGGLIGHSAGYTDDVFEAIEVRQMIACGCPAPFKFACFSSDQSVIGHLYADPYLPNYFSGDLGLAQHAIDIEYAGNLQIQSAGCFHVRLGQSKQTVTSFDHTTEVITVTAHGLENGNVVYVYPALSATLPTGLQDEEQLYFVINKTTDTLQLSKTSGGAAVTFDDNGSGTIWIVKVSNLESSMRVGDCTIDIKRYAAENHHCYALYDTFATTGRNIQQVHNLNTNYGNKQANQHALRLTRPWRLTNCIVGGNIYHAAGVDAINTTFLLDKDTGNQYTWFKNGTPPNATSINERTKNWVTDAISTDATTRINDLGIRSGTGSPEGVVTAPIGTVYINLSGGTSTTMYVKESGTGNTGWAAK